MIQEGQYQFSDGRVIWKPTRMYESVDQCIANLPNVPLEEVEFYADYFGWYVANHLYGHSQITGQLTIKLAEAARNELAKRKCLP